MSLFLAVRIPSTSICLTPIDCPVADNKFSVSTSTFLDYAIPARQILPLLEFHLQTILEYMEFSGLSHWQTGIRS